jgi:hypothetical protein
MVASAWVTYYHEGREGLAPTPLALDSGNPPKVRAEQVQNANTPTRTSTTTQSLSSCRLPSLSRQMTRMIGKYVTTGQKRRCHRQSIQSQ